MSPVPCSPLPAVPGLEAELQLDRLKPRLSRRVLLLRGHQASWHEELELDTGAPPVCRNLTAYLRVWGRRQRGLAWGGDGDIGKGQGTRVRDGDSSSPS